MIKKILIANRGEIAVRIISTAKEMGIKTAAVYSDFDKFSLFTRIADEAYYIGPPPAAQSYLNADAIIKAAKECKADAIHPGYGFLSERSSFSKRCEEEGIIFIGPSSASMELLGNKTNAKKIAIQVNVPVVPGTLVPAASFDDAEKASKQTGYPLLIKASAGGGGKGMRIVEREEDFESALRMSKNEARASFGDDSVFIEKYIKKGRHIEFQLLADKRGNVIHLGERECSMQRRLQKIIEETPSTAISDNLRYEMGEAAKKIVRAANYHNAGTIEFILDEDGKYYFLEMNTRLQVEHPITELRTGIDIVKEQIKIANGEKLSCNQEEVKFIGHAIECRVCAEDPLNNFFPSTGKITEFNKLLGKGLREDTGIVEGDEVPVYYDPMISKLVSYGPDRESALNIMLRGLDDYSINGIKTNIHFLKELASSDEFKKGNYYTKFVENEFVSRYIKSQELSKNEKIAALIGAALFKSSEANSSFIKNKAAGKWERQILQ